MSHVYAECVKSSETPYCFHYVTELYEDVPNLCSPSEIMASIISFPTVSAELKQHLEEQQQQQSKQPNKGCGNPWNFFQQSSTEKDHAVSQRPKAKELPTNGPRPSCVTKVKSRQETLEALDWYITADCWSVYMRDANTHEPKTTIYWQKYPSCELIGSRPTNMASLLLLLDLDQEVSTTKVELCVSLGSTAFMDMYVCKINDDQFIITIVSCVRS